MTEDIKVNEAISSNIVKTGTVNVGIVCKDGVVLAADRKMTLSGGAGAAYTAGKLKKIFEVNDRLILSIAGTASDAVRNVSILRAELRLKELRSKTKLSSAESATFAANMIFNNIRTPSMIPSIAHFLIAGYDESGFHLFNVSPDGFMEVVETYVSSGSGMMQADSILDMDYKKGMSVEEGVNLAVKCIKVSTGRDPAVGMGMDIYVVRKDKIEQIASKDFVYDLKDTK